MATIPTGSSAARGVLLQQGEHSKKSTETRTQMAAKIMFFVAGGMWQFWPPNPRLLPESFISVSLDRGSERLQRL